jgi:cytoskeletal protein RodZ
VAAATQSSFEVLILKKRNIGLSAVLAEERKLAGNFVEVRQLQASDVSNFSNSSDDEDETSTTVTTTSSSPVSVTTTVNATTNATTNGTTNATTTVNVSELEPVVAAELGQAGGLRVWSAAFFCFALRFLVR